MKAIQKMSMNYLDSLGPRARQVAEYVMEHPDAKQGEIAKALQISHTRVSQIVHNDRYLASLPGLARKTIKSMVPKAAKRYTQLMEQSENLEVSRKVTERVLDTNKVLDPEIHVNVNLYQQMPLSELINVIDKTKPLSRDIVDVEPVDDVDNA